ncbi:MAG: hypothetical protein IPK72_20185 [Candidatus Eisenbacteria bacterium]|nr:hypothetical protein [Candidatus Eisenbacteria bacterium]
MHTDGREQAAGAEDEAWERYIQGLKHAGHFEGGSAIGAGICVNKSGLSVAVSTHIDGFIKIRAESWDQARELLAGKPCLRGRGTIEIRELPRT